MNNRPKLKDRIYAFFIDLFAVSIIKLCLMVNFVSFAKIFAAGLPLKKQSHLIFNLYQIDFLLSLILFLGYFTFSLYCFKGKTLGKMVYDLEVHSDGNESISLVQSFMRSLGYFLCYILIGLPVMINFIRKDKLGLADLISSSITHFEKRDDRQGIRFKVQGQQQNQILTLPLPARHRHFNIIDLPYDKDKKAS